MHTAAQSTEAAPVTWVSFPLRDEPWRKSALLIAIVAVVSFVGVLQGLFYGALAFALMLIGLGPYFLPCRYEVSEAGVKRFFFLFNRARPWGVYKRYVPQKDGVFLGTFPAPSRLDSFRGDFLRFSRTTDRERVMALVRRHVGAQ